MRKQKVTVYDIAKEAGVSVAMVSRVLTGKDTVKEEKRVRIQELIDKYNFKPNALARSLYKKESRMIGFILPDITNPYHASVFLEAEKYALEKGYSIFLCNSLNDENIESTYLRVLTEKQVDGIIFTGRTANNIKITKKQCEEFNSIAENTPLVLVNGKMKGVDCYRINTDEEKGVFDLVEYLVSLGHKDIGFLGGAEGNTSTEIKFSAFKKAIKHFDLKFRKDWVIFGGYGVRTGKLLMEELLAKPILPTAIVTFSDFIAAGAIKTAHVKGVKIPEDISLVGFDNMLMSEIVIPEITTIDQNYAGLGKKSIETIIRAVNGEKPDKEVKLDVRLVIRESCRSISDE